MNPSAVQDQTDQRPGQVSTTTDTGIIIQLGNIKIFQKLEGIIQRGVQHDEKCLV